MLFFSLFFFKIFPRKEGEAAKRIVGVRFGIQFNFDSNSTSSYIDFMIVLTLLFSSHNLQISGSKVAFFTISFSLTLRVKSKRS